MTKRILIVAAAAAFALLGAHPASAHPLGNFTVNTYGGLRFEPERLVVDYIVDMAEIPAFQERRRVDADGDDLVSPAESAAYAASACERIARRVRVRADGRTIPLRSGAGELTFPPGVGDLPTLRLSCLLTGDVAGSRRISYADGNFAGRIGWHEITAVGDRVALVRSDVPAASPSRRLTSYPDDLLGSAPDRRSAALEVDPATQAGSGGEAAPAGSEALLPRSVDRWTSALTSLVSGRRSSPAFVVAAFAVAIVLGALHALAPGHGKTVMAAYVVGARGSFRQVLTIASTVTATHTAGVLTVGIVLSATSLAAPERVYPWLGLGSGLLLAIVGVSLLRHRLPSRHRPHGHPHAPRRVRSRGLVALGFAGGLVPSPSAILVLLTAIALGRAWLGVLLVIAYGIGMAATLTGAGLLLVRGRTRLERLGRQGGRIALVAGALPVAAAAAVLLIGMLVTARGIAQL